VRYTEAYSYTYTEASSEYIHTLRLPHMAQYILRVCTYTEAYSVHTCTECASATKTYIHWGGIHTAMCGTLRHTHTYTESSSEYIHRSYVCRDIHMYEYTYTEASSGRIPQCVDEYAYWGMRVTHSLIYTSNSFTHIYTPTQCVSHIPLWTWVGVHMSD